jgi:alginate O-acetyltransferase complex protein AlgI
MLFNSLSFAAFFTLFFLLYWFVFHRNVKLQNLLVLAGSYVFYCWWDWHFLALLAISSSIIFILGIGIYKATTALLKKLLFLIGVLFCSGTLLYFKYTNFFITSIIAWCSKLHIHTSLQTLHILLPLGISFYTFRLLSYLFEVRNGRLKPVTNWVVFCSYVSFFPSLVAGPIDRPNLLVPQLQQPRAFNGVQATDAMRQILWGLFKKVVIADNCTTITMHVFDTPNLHGFILIAGAFFFTIQIYADFSGYSDMAIGFARLLGFNITRNFNYPFFAQNIADFWRRWHISLTSWLTDYIFTPIALQLRYYGNAGLIISILITFLVSGLWHGANWTYVAWGAVHGCAFIPLILAGQMNKKKEIKMGILPTLTELAGILRTFIFVMLAMVLFRSNSLLAAFQYYCNIFNFSSFSSPFFYPASLYCMNLLFIIFMLGMEWRQRDKQHALQNLDVQHRALRWTFYSIALLLIMTFSGYEQPFIYLKF